MSNLDALLRYDCPGYNEALKAAFARDWTLSKDNKRATALAASLYERLSQLPHPSESIDPALVRPETVCLRIVSFNPLPAIIKANAKGTRAWWNITGIVDISGMSKAEQQLLRKVFSQFDYYQDDDYGQASFTALRTLQSAMPSIRYKSASVRLARDSALSCLLKEFDKSQAPIKLCRPLWARTIDRLLVAIG
jgi:hypothetical protein